MFYPKKYGDPYVTQFVQSYLIQVIRYDADCRSAKEDKAQLEAVNQAGAWQELLCRVQHHLQDEALRETRVASKRLNTVY